MADRDLASNERDWLLHEAVGDLGPAELDLQDGAVPLFDPRSIAAAVVSPDGRLIFANAAFRALGAEARLDHQRVADAARSAKPIIDLVEIAADGEQADIAVFAYARVARTDGWRLPPEVAEAAADAPGAVVVLTPYLGAAVGPLEAACRAYGLSGLQTRVALETIRTGSVNTAAERLGLSPHTAREAMSEVLRRTRAPRLPAVVTKLSSLAFGVLPDDTAAEVLVDLWGLTPRQSAICSLIASGLSRAEAGRALRLGEAVVRKELEQAFEVLQVGSAAALARRMSEARAMHWLTHATRGDLGFVDWGAEPLQFVYRPDGSRIALSDYGPASGKPVLVLHSATTTRPVSRNLLRALHAAGYRPLSIDRPGFGLTDDVPRAADRRERAAIAADDVVRVLDWLRTPKVDVVCRGGPQALALYARAPERLGRVVLVNPGMPGGLDRRRTGHFGLLKDLFARNPFAIRFMFRSVAQQTSLERFTRMTQRWVRESPPDLAAARRPELVRDYFMGIRMFATGRLNGVVAEQLDQMRDQGRAPMPGTRDWRVLMAAHDVLYDPQQTLGYWRGVLPDARFKVVEDAGRWLALSHPQYVVEALEEPS